MMIEPGLLLKRAVGGLGAWLVSVSDASEVGMERWSCSPVWFFRRAVGRRDILLASSST